MRRQADDLVSHIYAEPNMVILSKDNERKVTNQLRSLTATQGSNNALLNLTDLTLNLFSLLRR